MAKTPGDRVVQFEFPANGIVQAGAEAAQQPGTTSSCMNVVAFEPQSGRGRGGQRPGVSRLSNFPAGPSQLILQTDLPQTNTPGLVALFDEVWGEYSTGDIGTVGTAHWSASPTPMGAAVTHGTNQLVFTGSTPWVLTGPTLTYNVAALHVIEAKSFAWNSTPSSATAQVFMTMEDGPSGYVALRIERRTDGSCWVNIVYVNSTGNGQGTFFQIAGYTTGTALDLLLSIDSNRNASLSVNGTVRVTLAIPGGTAAAAGTGVVLFEGSAVANWTLGELVCSVNFGAMPIDGRLLRSIHVAGGTIYGGTITFMTAATGGSNLFNPYALLSGDFGEGNAYIVDGTNTWQVAISNMTVTALTATAGTVPAGCRICVVWNDRLILANQAGGGEQNIFASRQGLYTDWLVAQQDAQTAWALNAVGTAGHVGQPVACLAPITSDLMMIGCDTQIYMMEGDPAAGGAVRLASPTVGIFGQHAWCVNEKGVIYFVGSGGFWRFHPKLAATFYGEQAMENLSDKKYPQFFQQLNRASQNVIVEWDQDRRGCWIFASPGNGTQGTHLFWDERTEGFFPVQFPAAIGPSSAAVYDGDFAGQRGIMLGGNDGNLRLIDPTALGDDGTAITSVVTIGPKALGAGGPFDQGIISGMEFWLGEFPANQVNLAWEMQVGNDAVTALAGSNVGGSGTFTTTGRQQKTLTRSRGCYAVLELTSSTLGDGWTFELCAVLVKYGGINR